MSGAKYHLTEPFPAPQRQYTGYGRGGAGNYTRNSRQTSSFESTTSTKDNNVAQVSSQQPYPPPRDSISGSKPSPNRKTFTGGRGGWGNAHPASERAMFSFDEELERARLAERAMAPIYHIGVGGAGNRVTTKPRIGSSGESTRSGSTSSGESERSFRERVKSRFSRMGSS